MTQEAASVHNYIKQKGQVTPAQLSKALRISPQAVHKHLRNLLKVGYISKQGSAPKVSYQARTEKVSHGRITALVKAKRYYF